MNFQEALRIKIGDRLYTHNGEIIVISGWQHNFEDPLIKDDLYFTCINASTRTIRYRYDELCGFELCDEDKMFVDWYANYSNQDENIIPSLKNAFMKGFEYGFSHKQKVYSEQQLQK